jgi:hypothetical protein
MSRAPRWAPTPRRQSRVRAGARGPVGGSFQVPHVEQSVGNAVPRLDEAVSVAETYRQGMTRSAEVRAWSSGNPALADAMLAMFVVLLDVVPALIGPDGDPGLEFTAGRTRSWSWARLCSFCVVDTRRLSGPCLPQPAWWRSRSSTVRGT